MIQRKQTLWLLLALVCTGLSVQFPFYTVAEPNTQDWTRITAQTSIITLLIAIAVAVGSLFAIFLYKTRPRQLWVTIVCTLLAVLQVVLLYSKAASYDKGNPSLTAVLPLAAVVFLAMAALGIRKDEKLMKELNSNRLR
jgi:peptidoglycan/LPS O-acetylase OafA/YrhL